jgi:hypothetical protein
VNFRRLLQVLVSQAKTKARAHLDGALEVLAPSRAPRLSQDLRRLLEEGRRVTFFLSERDSAYDILMAGARRTVERGIRSGRLRLEMIAGADHTFSQSRPRAELARRMAAHLSRA